MRERKKTQKWGGRRCRRSPSFFVRQKDADEETPSTPARTKKDIDVLSTHATHFTLAPLPAPSSINVKNAHHVSGTKRSQVFGFRRACPIPPFLFLFPEKGQASASTAATSLCDERGPRSFFFGEEDRHLRARDASQPADPSAPNRTPKSVTTANHRRGRA